MCSAPPQQGHCLLIVGAMAELESSLISERVTAGMRAAEARSATYDHDQTHYLCSH
jgi:hypothetical protein